MNRKIIVPLDGSELAERALLYAKAPASRIGSEVILLHVCGPEECHCDAEKCTVQPMHRVYVEHTAQMFRNRLEAVATDKIHKIQIDWEVLVGDPATQIVSYAGEQKADRIIIASHGRSGINRWILGSVTDKVARESCLVQLAQHEQRIVIDEFRPDGMFGWLDDVWFSGHRARLSWM